MEQWGSESNARWYNFRAIRIVFPSPLTHSFRVQVVKTKALVFDNTPVQHVRPVTIVWYEAAPTILKPRRGKVEIRDCNACKYKSSAVLMCPDFGWSKNGFGPLSHVVPITF